MATILKRRVFLVVTASAVLVLAAAWAAYDVHNSREVARHIGQLQSGDTPTARAAADALVAKGGRSIAIRMIPLLADTAYEVRARHVLLRIGRPAVGPLVSVATCQMPSWLGPVGASPTDKGHLVNVAGDTLVAMGPSAVAPLVSVLRGGKSESPARAAALLLRIGDEVSIDAVCAVLADSPPDVTLLVVEALESQRHPRVIECLIKLLGSPDERLRFAAAAALDAPDCLSAFDRLASLLAGEKNIGVRSITIKSLGRMRRPEAVPLLAALLGNTSDPASVRCVAARALGVIADKSASGALLAACKDGDPAMRGAAASALGDLIDPSAVAALVGVLSDEDPGVREAAADSLGQLKDPSAVPALVTALADSQPSVCASAMKSLGLIGDPAAVDPLVALTSNIDDAVRQSAAAALGDIGDPRAVTALVPLLYDGNSELRGIAADALGCCGGAAAVEALIPALEKERSVRAVSFMAFALGDLKDPRAVPALEQLLGKTLDEKSDLYFAALTPAAVALRQIDAPEALAAIDKHAAGRDLAEIAANYASYMRKGDDADRIPLVLALAKHGNVDMARAFYYSSEPRLKLAAATWADRFLNTRDNLIDPVFARNAPLWGGW